MVDIGNNRQISNPQSKYFPKDCKISKEDIIELGDKRYMVPSQRTQDVFYGVNMYDGYCECPQGRNLGPCIHKFAIAKAFNISEFSVVPVSDPKMRALYHYIATGVILEDSWYRGLHSAECDHSIGEFVQCRIASSHQENLLSLDDVSPSVSGTINDFVNKSLSQSENYDCDDDEDEDEENSKILEDFEDAVNVFVKSSKQRLKEDQSYLKAIQSFTKSLKKISTSKKGTFERSLFTFSKEQSGPKGTKNKKGKLITVQSTALACRRYKHRGRSVAPLGRKRF